MFADSSHPKFAAEFQVFVSGLWVFVPCFSSVFPVFFDVFQLVLFPVEPFGAIPGEVSKGISGNFRQDMIEASPKTTVAAINGPALGGGCEVSLACQGCPVWLIGSMGVSPRKSGEI